MKNQTNLSRKLFAIVNYSLMGVATLLTTFIVLFIIGYLFVKGLPHIDWNLLSTKPSYIDDNIGILPNILNTLYLVIATVVIVIPLGTGAAIYLTEYAKDKRITRLIEYASETLSGIPSIIYGLVGMLFFSQFMGLKTSILAGALTMVMMTLPTVMRTTQESLKTVPQSYRDGAFALGSGKWRVVRTVVLPGCIDGLLTGVILSIGRVIGESAALLFTAGFAHNINGFFEALTSSGASLTVALYVYAKERGEFEIAFAIAAILMIITLFFNTLVVGIGRANKRK